LGSVQNNDGLGVWAPAFAGATTLDRHFPMQDRRTDGQDLRRVDIGVGFDIDNVGAFGRYKRGV
jgi:hypothetical protein